MTDAEARELIENNIRLIRDSYHWGQVIVEVRNGKIYRVNLTVSATSRTNTEDKKCGRINPEK